MATHSPSIASHAMITVFTARTSNSPQSPAHAPQRRVDPQR
jgi:hypothetical protein